MLPVPVFVTLTMGSEEASGFTTSAVCCFTFDVSGFTFGVSGLAFDVSGLAFEAAGEDACVPRCRQDACAPEKLHGRPTGSKSTKNLVKQL